MTTSEPNAVLKRRWSLIGPGIVVAATGVGAGDLVATLIAGSRFGYALLWAAIIGTGFWATSFSSLLGVWQGVSLMFADFTAHVRGRAGEEAVCGDRSRAFRGFALWLTFPPMALLFMDRPFGLIVAYGVLGSLFMPFLAGTLLWLLNSDRVPRAWRSHGLSNTLLAAGGLLFAVLAAKELAGLF